jgi:hypothetical protein
MQIDRAKFNYWKTRSGRKAYELAFALKVSESLISHWVRCATPLPQARIQQLAELLGCSLADLVVDGRDPIRAAG